MAGFGGSSADAAAFGALGDADKFSFIRDFRIGNRFSVPAKALYAAGDLVRLIMSASMNESTGKAEKAGFCFPGEGAFFVSFETDGALLGKEAEGGGAFEVGLSFAIDFEERSITLQEAKIGGASLDYAASVEFTNFLYNSLDVTVSYGAGNS